MFSCHGGIKESISLLVVGSFLFINFVLFFSLYDISIPQKGSVLNTWMKPSTFQTKPVR